jgi:hypothetical protein
LILSQTHNVALGQCLPSFSLLELHSNIFFLARPIAHFVVTFGADGRVKSQGSIAELTKSSGALASRIRKDQQALDKVQQEVDTPAALEKPVPKADGKLIVAEEIQEGHVSAAAGSFRSSYRRLILML